MRSERLPGPARPAQPERPLRAEPVVFLPDIRGEAESGRLLPQPGQGGPSFPLQAHQLRIAQDLLHQLPVPVHLLLGSLQDSPGNEPRSGGQRDAWRGRPACRLNEASGSPGCQSPHMAMAGEGCCLQAPEGRAGC